MDSSCQPNALSQIKLIHSLFSLMILAKLTYFQLLKLQNLNIQNQNFRKTLEI